MIRIDLSYEVVNREKKLIVNNWALNCLPGAFANSATILSCRRHYSLGVFDKHPKNKNRKNE